MFSMLLPYSILHFTLQDSALRNIATDYQINLFRCRVNFVNTDMEKCMFQFYNTLVGNDLLCFVC